MDLRSPRVWRPKHAAIHDFLTRHSATTEQIARRFFTGKTLATRRKKARRWIAKQRRRGKLRVIGPVQRRDTGRPEMVYGRACKLDQIEHEVRITDLALIFQDSPFVRDAKVGRTEADALMTRDGKRCYIELDNTVIFRHLQKSPPDGKQRTDFSNLNNIVPDGPPGKGGKGGKGPPSVKKN